MLSLCVITGLFLEHILLAGGAFSMNPGPIVSTKAGRFQGLQVTPPGLEQSVYAFVGIPYAKPPTGRLRFNKPVPADFIPGVYDATTKPPACFQLEADFIFPWVDRYSPMSEDCLYLNIWIPENMWTTGELKPVLVWIHGGGFISGSSAMDLYDGQVLSSLGDVVVVTFNYRLGPFGYLNFLTDDAPGNAALYDQLLALRWVQTNIEFFGGDPERVTLSGASAGAKQTGHLSVSPLSRGLFHRVIAQSGSPYALVITRPSVAAENANLLATLVGCAKDAFNLFTKPKKVLSCMRSVPASDLTKIYYEQNGRHEERIEIYYGPQFWDEIIPKRPIDVFLSGNFRSYDMFAGVTKDEGFPLFPFFFPEIYQQYAEGKLILNKTLAAPMLSGLYIDIGLRNPQRAVDFYFKDIGDDEQSVLTALSDGIGDPVMTCPTVYYAERYAEKGRQVWFYRFDHKPSMSPWPESRGGAHLEEIQFVFGLPLRYPERYTDEEKALSEYMIRTWTNFVKSEDLTLKNGSTWPNYCPWKPTSVTLDTCQKVGCGVRTEACEFWRPEFRAWQRRKGKNS